MRLQLARYILPVLLALAFAVRWEPARTLRLAPDESRDLGGASWLIDHPDTCQELRRIELALAGDRVPEFDTFVNFPAGGEMPSFSFFDASVASVAQRFLRSASGEVALGGVPESALEDFVIKLSPILGLIAVLITYWTARTIVGGPYGTIGALVAAAIAAFHPSLVATTSAGVLDSSSLLVILFALALRSTVRSTRADAMPAALLDALLAGALAGVLVAGSALGLALFVPLWLTFFVNSLRAVGEARRNALRSAIFFTIVAAFLARLPGAESAPAEPGIVARFQGGASLLALFSVLPLVVLFLLERSGRSSWFRTACLIAAGVVVLSQIPKAWEGLAPGVGWFFTEHETLTQVMPDLAPGFARIEFWSSAVFGLAAIVIMWRERRQAGAFALLLALGVLLPLSAATAAALPFLALAVACAVARALDALAPDEGVSVKRTARFAAVIVVLFLIPALSPSLRDPDPGQREQRLDFVAGLRWMRANTTSGGPWNSPRAPSSWGVVASVADGPLVHYHARRPAVLSPWAVLSGARALDEVTRRTSVSGDMSPLQRLMDGQGAPFVVVGAGSARGARDLVTRSGHSVLDELVDRAASTPPREEDGFELVHVSLRRVDPSGKTVLDSAVARPVIAIWRLTLPANAIPRAEMRPR